MRPVGRQEHVRTRVVGIPVRHPLVLLDRVVVARVERERAPQREAQVDVGGVQRHRLLVLGDRERADAASQVEVPQRPVRDRVVWRRLARLREVDAGVAQRVTRQLDEAQGHEEARLPLAPVEPGVQGGHRLVEAFELGQAVAERQLGVRELVVQLHGALEVGQRARAVLVSARHLAHPPVRQRQVAVHAQGELELLERLLVVVATEPDLADAGAAFRVALRRGLLEQRRRLVQLAAGQRRAGVLQVVRAPGAGRAREQRERKDREGRDPREAALNGGHGRGLSTPLQ